MEEKKVISPTYLDISIDELCRQGRILQELDQIIVHLFSTNLGFELHREEPVYDGVLVCPPTHILEDILWKIQNNNKQIGGITNTLNSYSELFKSINK